MLNLISGSVLSGSLTAKGLIICSITSVILGLGIGFLYRFRNTYNKGFILTLMLLPPIVQLVIMMVNGNIGAGMAVAGAFSLVRFRSVPGNARDITNIFFAMAIGLTTGMGYLGLAVTFFYLFESGRACFPDEPFRFRKGRRTDFAPNHTRKCRLRKRL